MALNVPRWVGWTLVFTVIAAPGSILARWAEQTFGWDHLWQDILIKLPFFYVACMVASRLFPLQSQRKPE
jgi:hypothetical protein